MKAEIITLTAKKSGTVELDEAIFGLEPRADILHRVVRWQHAKRQAGTHKAPTRGEISLSKRKSGRQKGSGGARHGNRSVSQFRSGGVAFGPVPRSHAHDLPKKVRRLGLCHAISAKCGSKKLLLLEDAKLTKSKSSELRRRLDKLSLTNALIIDGAEIDNNFRLAARNLPKIDILPARGANVRDILAHEWLVLTREAVSQLHARLA